MMIQPLLKTSTLSGAAIALLLSLGMAAPAQAQPAQKQVLVLQSFERGNLVFDQFIPNFHVELDQRLGRPVNFVPVRVGPAGAVGASDQAVVDYIRSLFRDRSGPDLIVSVAGPASVFARQYRAQLFPEVPLLFAAVDERYLGETPPGDRETAVAVSNDYPRVVDEVLELLPETRQVFMVIGAGSHGTFWRRQLEEQFVRFHDRVTFVWFDNLSLSELLRRAATLPNQSALYFVAFDTDAAGSAYADGRVLADLHATANAPVLGVHSVYLGAGILGGSLMSIEQLSATTADAAVRLLNGADPRTVDVPIQQPGPPTFDWRELQRWGIPENRLPAGSVVRYRAPSLWSAYRGTVLIAVAMLAVQSLLIAGLLYQRRARHRAEVESRQHLALAADASRRETMSALTNSIAHELGQPLSSMIHNAQAGRMMIGAPGVAADTIDEILADIEGQGLQAAAIIDRHRAMLRSREIDQQLIDLHAVIHDTLTLVAHDMRTRHIAAVINLSKEPCLVAADPVLMQQVLVNLVMNAMEAMADTPPLRRRVTISSIVRPLDVEVSVRDAGTGLSEGINGKLFTPFVTTKAHGLGIGLTITRTIVEAHGGSIEARNNPDGGATFTVTLRRHQASGRAPGQPSAA